MRRLTRSLLSHQRFVSQPKLRLRLDVVRIDRDAVDRADLHALRLIEVADALGALAGIYHVDLQALRDRAVRALRLADVAVDAFVGDHQGHGRLSLRAAVSRRVPRTSRRAAPPRSERRSLIRRRQSARSPARSMRT